jgi:hypothetical protein
MASVLVRARIGCARTCPYAQGKELQKTLQPPTDWERSPAGAVTTGERRYSLRQTRATVERD